MLAPHINAQHLNPAWSEHPGAIDGPIGRDNETPSSTTLTLLPPTPMMGLPPIAGYPAVGLPTGTAILTPGGPVSVEHMVRGRETISLGVRGRVASLTSTLWQPTVTIHHAFGMITVGADQPIPVFTRLDRWEAKRARLLDPGDRILFDGIGYEGVETSLPPLHLVRHPRNTRGHFPVIPPLDPETAWLIGMIHGNGYVFVPRSGVKTPNAHLNVSLGMNYPEMAGRVERAMARFGVRPKRHELTSDGVAQEGSGTWFRISLFSNDLAHYMHEHVKQPGHPIRVPDFIFQATRDVRAAYLAGVLDSDGSARGRGTILVTTVYDVFARDIALLYASLGIAVRFRHLPPREPNARPKTNITTSGVDNLDTLYRTVGRFSTKLQHVNRQPRSQHGFTFPNDLVRLTHKGHWIVNERVTTDRVSRHTGLHFSAKPLEVIAVTTGPLDHLHLPQVGGVGMFNAFGLLLSAEMDEGTMVSSVAA